MFHRKTPSSAATRSLRYRAGRLLHALRHWRPGGTEAGPAASLAAQNRRLEELTATLNLGLAMVRDLDGTIRFWSEGCARLYGWTAAEAVGRRSHDLLQTRFPQPLAGIEAALLRDGEWTGDLIHRTRAGEEVIVAARKVLRRDAEGRPASVLESVTDVTDRRQAEAALRERAALLEATSDSVFAVDGDWRITFINRRAIAQIARGRDLQGRSLWEAFPEAVGGPFWHAFQRTMAERVPAGTDAFYPPLGLHIAAESHPGEDGGIVVFFRDVTEERAAAARLAESEARFRTLAEALPSLLFVAAPDGGNIYTNARFQAFAGLPAEALLGDGWLSVLHAEDRGRAAAAWAEAVVSGKAYEAEFRFRRHDGAWRWFLVRCEPERDAEGRILRWHGTCTDVHELRRAEARQAASEERLRSVVETAADAILVADSGGRIVASNPAAVRMFGYDDASQLTGKDLGLLMPQAEAVRHGGYLAGHRRDASGGARARVIGVPGRELMAVRRDGAEFPIELSVASFTSEGERYFTGVIRDVTERKRAEDLRRLLAREVDHRAKNALAVALSLLRLTPRDDVTRFAASVEGRIAAMARAHSLLATAKWAGADFRTLAEGELAAYAGRVLLFGPPMRLAPEAVQPMAMLLHELATNAAKYGALTTEMARILISWQGAEGGRLRLRWEEQGGPRLAAPPDYQGFGSRLIDTLVHQQLRGSVRFEWPATGLCCTIEIPAPLAMPADPIQPAPVSPKAAEPERLAPPPAPAAVAGAVAVGPLPRVLMVEDEALLAMELEATLRDLGYEVVGPARTLTEAVRLAATETNISAAVLDVNLGSGEFSFPAVDLLQTRGVPYIFSTGYGSARSLQGRDHGAVAVLIKPYPREAMAEALGAALRQGPAAEEPV